MFKKNLFTLLLCLATAMLFGQQVSNLKFEVQSKYETDIELDITVKYGGKIEYSLKDIIIRKIHAVINDSLNNYDAIEIYTMPKTDVNRIINNAYRDGLGQKKIEFNEVVLNNLKIPEELRMLYEQKVSNTE